jgi:hypothetical protein
MQIHPRQTDYPGHAALLFSRLALLEVGRHRARLEMLDELTAISNQSHHGARKVPRGQTEQGHRALTPYGASSREPRL